MNQLRLQYRPRPFLAYGARAARARAHVRRRTLHGEVCEARQLLAAAAVDSVVISEIMYHPQGDDVRDEYFELYNPQPHAVTLNGWRVSRGVDFLLTEATLPADGYLVVAADVARFRANYPDVAQVVGGWQGKLSNQGETLELLNAHGVVVDSVRYADQGDWAVRREGPLDHGHRGWEWDAAHDGAGRSLELRNARLPNELGQNWSASQVVGGTPGRVNSVASLDIAPLIVDVAHDPPLPRASDSIQITAALVDEVTMLSHATVIYRRDGEAIEQRQPLRDDGTQGDATAGDGRYTALLPPQPDGTRLQFRIEAEDMGGQQQVWPLAEAAASGARPDALLIVSDQSPRLEDLQPGDQPIHHVVLTTWEEAELADIGDGPLEEAASNAAFNATWIHLSGGGVEIRYLMGIRNRGGSSRIGPPNNYRLEFPHDAAWQGRTAVNLNCQYVHSQILGSAIYQAAGIPAAEALPVKLFINAADAAEPIGPRMFGSFAQLQVVDGDFIDEAYSDDTNGNLYRAVVAGGESGDLRYEGPDAAAYRDTYLKRTNESLDDWSDLIQLVDVLQHVSDAEFIARIEQVIDVDQWLRFLALDSLLGNRETGLSFGAGDNYWLYRGELDTRFRLIPHDLDTLMGNGRLAQPNRSILTYTAVPGLQRLLTHPQTVPRYYRAFLELIDQLYNPDQLDPMIDQLLGSFVPLAERNELKQFVRDRTQGVLAQLSPEFVINSPLPKVNGIHRTTLPFAELEGTAYAVETQSVRVNGQLADWSPLTREWSVRPQGEGRTEILVAAGGSWKYRDDGSDQQSGWRALEYDDTTWSAGVAPLGYGYNDEATRVSYGPNPHDKFITTYYRRPFSVDDPSEVLDAVLRLQVDDGAVVYLNGQEVARVNMPDTELDFQSLASRWVGSTAQQTFESLTVDAQMLRPGTNLLAVEVHQRSPADNDLRFDLSLEARVGRLTGGVPLHPGLNRVSVQAFQGTQGAGEIVAEDSIDIWYDGAVAQDSALCAELQRTGQLPPAVISGGVLTQDTTLAPCGPAYQIQGEVTVPAGVTLTVLSGTSLLFAEGSGLVVDQGRLIAEGEPNAPIRFTRQPDSTGTWRGIQLRDSLADNRLKHAVLEYGVNDAGMLGLEGSQLTVDQVTFDHTHLFRIRTVNSSLLVTNSTFTDIFAPDEEPTTDNRSEHIWGSGILAGGQLLIQGNWFGSTKGHNDSIDFDGAQRPAAIPRIIDNQFVGGGDDALDLETDAHIEGNVFVGIHKDPYNSSTGDSNAISAGAGREYVVVRNVFYDVDHAVQVKDEAFLTFDHNTVSHVAQSAIYFELDERGPGRGANVTDSIFHEVTSAFAALGPATQLQVHRSIVPPDALPWGEGNQAAEPRLADVGRLDFSLRPGSPARGTGRAGSDRGAGVSPGPWIDGAPERITSQRDTILTVVGPSWIAYRYRVNQGQWSEARDLAEPITLAQLPDGDYTVEIVGQDSSGTWQSLVTPSVSLQWTVSETAGRVRLNELFASSSSGDVLGMPGDWIELYNSSFRQIDLSGRSLSDDASQPRKFVFPVGSVIEPQGYLMVAANDVAPIGILATGFRLSADGESLLLFDRPERGGMRLDEVTFGPQPDGFSIGRVGRTGGWQLTQRTPGTANLSQSTGDPKHLSINEWLARPGMRVVDEYLEIYNADSLPVELSGLILTDNPAFRPTGHIIAPLSFVAGQGAVRWITDGNEVGGPDHLEFELNGEQELITLTDSTGRVLDQVASLQQLSGVAQGRSPDGAELLAFFTVPTPGQPNPTSQTSETSLVNYGATWRYSAMGSLPDADWYRPAFDDSLWPEGLATFAAGPPPVGRSVGTPLSLGPITYYFRHTLQLSEALLRNDVELAADLRMFVDDGVLIYVNGTAVLRQGLPEGEVGYTTRADRGIGIAAEEGPFIISAHLLQVGSNVIAAEVHQVSPSSGDVAFDLALNLRSTIRDPFLENARAILADLRVTEVMYHPAGDESVEFIELQNIGSQSINLRGVRLTDGIELILGDERLEAGQLGVVVRDLAAFRRTYGTEPRVLGVYAGALDNGSDRWRLRLPEPLDVDILHLSYRDDWFRETDGEGRSLLAKPTSVEPNVWARDDDWYPSQRRGGTPGATNAADLRGDANLDGQLSVLDVDAVCSAWIQRRSDVQYDINEDDAVDSDDIVFMLGNLLQTGAGDVNLDGVFNSADLVAVFQAGQYDRGPSQNAAWSQGDWNCDGQFNSSDLVLAFQTNIYLA